MKPKTIESAEAFLAEMFSMPVTIEGREMTAREAYIRGIHARALAGDADSLVQLDQLRRSCGADETVRAGYLVVPAALSLEEWSRLAAEQQRPFREHPNGSEG
ncbi:hypothetical protein B0I00_2751 [Novosphingobium kunmingense]|uniref:Uncharacterized protein n=1 Tax=Novosphingobium kunmingense TaxID=1211806 RepID=A0A2N0H5B8_9SPHN|nr:hypothetical protein [Novosphingobium kunmingense]PKB14122.1 hypothetical protein B0I00_2751 [Novosphingobium kunmingense]